MCAHLFWGVQGGGQDHLSWSVYVLPAASWLLHSSLSLCHALSVPADLPAGEGGAPGEETFPVLQLPSRDTRSFFPFPPTLLRYMVIFLVVLITEGLLPEFSRYSVRIVPHVNVFLMYLWEEVSSTSFYSTILISSPNHI